MPRPALPFVALPLLVVSSLLNSPLLAEEQQAEKHTLRYKFHTGDVLRYDITHNASIRSTLDGTTERVQMRTESTKAWKIIDVLPSGEIEVQNVVERVKMTNSLQDHAKMTFDSTKDKTPPPGFEDAAKAIGVPLSHIRITPWGKVLKHDIKHHQPAADPHAPLAVLLPEPAVAIGDTWDEPVEIRVKLSDGGSKAISTRRHFRLTSVQNGVAEIEAAHQVLSSITPEIEGQLAQRLMTGKIRFDLHAGQILSQEFEVDKRVLGFAGQASSMHYVMQMKERLQEPENVASRDRETSEK